MSKSKDIENKKRANFWLDEELHSKFKALAALEQKSMSELVEDWIRKFVERKEKGVFKDN